MKTRAVVRIVVGLCIIGGGVGYFMYQAMQSSWSYYYSVDDMSANAPGVKNQSLRIAGRVKPNTVTRDLQNMILTFTLAGDKAELHVRYHGVVPDNFTPGNEVVVEGRLDTSGTFQADTLLTKCESKYKAKVK